MIAKYSTLLFLLFAFVSKGQEGIDSALWQQQMATISIASQHTFPDSSIYFAKEALASCERLNDRSGATKCLLILAQSYRRKKDIPTALRYYLQALKTSETLREPQKLTPIHLELASLYEIWLVHEKAFDHYQKALETNTEETNFKIQLIAIDGMARTAYESGRLEIALVKYQQLKNVQDSLHHAIGAVEALRNIIKIQKEQGKLEAALASNKVMLQRNEALKDTGEIIIAFNNIGVLHKQLNDLSQALTHFTKAAEMEAVFRSSEESNPITLTNIGILYQNLGDYQNSLRYLFEAEESLKNEAPLDIQMLANISNLIAIIFLTTNDFNNAHFYNQQAIDLSKAIFDDSLLEMAYKTRSSIYEQINDHREALAYYRLHDRLEDSLLRANQQQREANLLKQFSAEQTEKEITLLSVDREIEELKLRQDLLENERLRQETALQESLLEKQKLEKQQTEQALLFTKEELVRKKAEQDLLVTQQQLETNRKNQQIALLEKEQSEQTLLVTQQRLEAEQKDRALVQAAKEQAELDLTLREKDFELQNQREKLLRNTALGVLVALLIITILVYRNNRLRRRANRVLAHQKRELETALANLKQAQGQLVQAEKMASLGELTAGIAHEINNPLNFVTTNTHALKLDLQDIKILLDEVHQLKTKPTKAQVEVILEKVEELDTEFLNEETQELIESIERGALRTKNIVSGLRIFSRNANDEFVQANLHEGLDSTLIILNSKLKDRISIHKNYGNLPLVTCQFDKLNQVFMNILSNAIQAIKGKGDIYIQTQQKDEFVRISIKDTGTGMPKSVQGRIFEPFFTTKEVGKGTGLGLSISYGIIEQHRGQIEVHSEEGRGTEFIVNLPINSGQ